jgi:ribosomal protein L30/L7E
MPAFILVNLESYHWPRSASRIASATSGASNRRRKALDALEAVGLGDRNRARVVYGSENVDTMVTGTIPDYGRGHT